MKPLKKKIITLSELQDSMSELATEIKGLEDKVIKLEKLGGHIKVNNKSAILRVYIKSIDIQVNWGKDYSQNLSNTITIDLGLGNVIVEFSNIGIKREDWNGKQSNIIHLNALECGYFHMKKCDFSNIEVNLSITHSNRELRTEHRWDVNDQVHIEANKFMALTIKYKEAEGLRYGWTTGITDNTIEKDLSIKHDANSISPFYLNILGNVVNGGLILDLYNGEHNRSDGYFLNLLSGNKIKFMNVKRSYPNVIEWGLREFIGENIFNDAYDKGKRKSSKDKQYRTDYRESRSLMIGNKKVLIKFKAIAIEAGDKLLENTLNYRITKCDELLVEDEKGFLQEKIIMKAGKLLSRHGTSWVLPVFWIVKVNLSVIFIAFVSLWVEYPDAVNLQNIGFMFFQLLNPISSPLDISQEIIDKSEYTGFGISFWIIAVLALLYKVFYAICIYEIVRAARRFTIR